MKTIVSVTSALFLLASGLTAPAQTLLLQDSFALNGTTRVAGASLSNKTVENYDPTMFSGSAPIWQAAGGQTVFSSTGSIVPLDPLTSGAIQAVVEVPNISSGTLTLKMDLVVGNAEWVGFQFMSSSMPKHEWGAYNWFYSGNELFAMINGSGQVQLFRNGTGTQLGSWNIAGFSKTTIYSLQLDYDRDASAATIWVNDTPIVSGFSITDLNDPTIGYVGFRSQGADMTNTTVDNFSYLGTVPEPNTMVLLTASLATVCFARRRKSSRASLSK
jgi:hypothetical protein